MSGGKPSILAMGRAMLTQPTLLVAEQNAAVALTVAEALTAATYGSAQSLGLAEELGSIEVGKRADVVILDVPSHEDVAYRIGRNNARVVIKDGAVVAVRDHDDPARGLLRRREEENR